jgi:HAD superfamily hydrolase (TIGR01484 family)
MLTAGEFIKLLVLRDGTDADGLTSQVRKVLGDRLEATHSSPSRALVEVAAAGVSKAAALAALTERLGIDPREVAAFGDMPNDLQMLRWAGMPYVMGHAHPDLLALGATVIGSNRDSAVGATIESWL